MSFAKVVAILSRGWRVEKCQAEKNQAWIDVHGQGLQFISSQGKDK